MFQRRTSIALFLVAIAAGFVSGQETTLEWKFEKDKVFYQTMTTKTDQSMKVSGTDVVQKQEQTFYFSWTPIKLDDKTKVVELKQKIIGLKMNIDIGGSKINYDSTVKDAQAANNPLNKFFEAMIGTEFKLTLDTVKMQATAIEGHKAFVDKLTETNPQMKPLLEKILSEKALRDMAEPLFAALPGKKVKKGDATGTWTRDTTLDMGPIGKYETKYTYTYDGPNKDKQEIVTVKTDIKYTPPAAEAAGGLPFKIKDAKLDAKDSTGTITVEGGILKKSEMKLTLAGNLTIEIGQQTTPVELKQEQTTTMETSDKDPTKK